MKSFKIYFLLGFLAFSLGCQNSMEVSQALSSTSLGDNPSIEEMAEIDLDKIEHDTVSAEEAVDEALIVLNELVDDQGNIHLSSDGHQKVSAQGFIIPDKYLDKLAAALNKILDAAEKAQSTLEEAQSKLENAMAQLDPSDPNSSALLVEMERLYQELDHVKDRLHDLFLRVAGKIDRVLNRVDQYIRRLPALAQIAAYFIWGDVEDLLIDFRDQLLAL